MISRRNVLLGLAAVWLSVSLKVIWTHASASFPAAFWALTAPLRTPFPGAGPVLKHLAVVAGQGIGIVLLAFTLVGLGKCCARWIGSSGRVSPSEMVAAHLLAGVGMYAMVGFALGLCGVVFPAVIAGVWLLALCAAFASGPSGLRVRDFGISSVSERVFAGLLAVAIGGLVVFAIAPEVTEDAMAYHLGLPEHTRSLHKLVDAPYRQFRWPLLGEQFITAFLGILSSHALNLLSFLGLGLLMYGWLQRRWGVTAALLGIAGLLMAADIISIVPINKPDVLAVAFSLLAVVAWDRTILHHGSRGANAVVLGAAFGWAFCTKFTTVTLGIGILVWHVLFQRGLLKSRFTALVVAGFLAAALPFLAKVWMITGNPVYPFLFGGLQWTEVNFEYMKYGFPAVEFDPTKPWQVLALLVRLGTQQVPLAWIGVPLLLVSAMRGFRANHLAMCIAGCFAASIWIFQIPFLRFLTPIYPVIIVFGAIAIASIAAENRIKTGIIFSIVAVILAIKYLGVVGQINMAGTKSKPILPVALGLVTSEAFQERTLTTYWRAVRFMSARDSTSGKLLLVGDPGGALFSRVGVTVSQDGTDLPLVLRMSREAHTPQEIRKKFKQLGISVVGLNYINSLRNGGVFGATYWSWEEIRRYYEFCRRWMEPLGFTDRYDIQNGGWSFYRLRSKGGAHTESMPYLPGTEGLLALSRQYADRAGVIEKFEELVRLAPGVAAYRCTLGELLVDDRQWQKGAAHLEWGVANGLPFAETYGKLGVALWNLARYRDAEAAFGRAATLHPWDQTYKQWRDKCAAAADR